MEQPKYRHEMKYLVSSAQIAMLRARMNGLLSPDPHAGADGKYHISSLYFDDYDDCCFYENENGTDPREKFRVRIYDHFSDRVTLELKRKERGKTLKRAAPITVEQAQLLIRGKRIPNSSNQSALLQKLSLEIKQHLLHPVVIVEYDRYPYVYKSGNVRITFDVNISSSLSIPSFLEAEYPKRPVMPTGLQLMEVKYDEYLPDFIYSALQLENLRQTTYSKYYICRKYDLK